MARHSFKEDWSELLERFGHKGTPAALNDQLRDAEPKSPGRRRCRAFHLNETLFERSQR